jgi:hypothetical protein
VSFLGDVAGALKNVVLMQSHLERLERGAERQDRDIAGLREVMARLSERLVRVETIIDEARDRGRAIRRLPEQ